MKYIKPRCFSAIRFSTDEKALSAITIRPVSIIFMRQSQSDCSTSKLVFKQLLILTIFPFHNIKMEKHTRLIDHSILTSVKLQHLLVFSLSWSHVEVHLLNTFHLDLSTRSCIHHATTRKRLGFIFSSLVWLNASINDRIGDQGY